MLFIHDLRIGFADGVEKTFAYLVQIQRWWPIFRLFVAIPPFAYRLAA